MISQHCVGYGLKLLGWMQFHAAKHVHPGVQPCDPHLILVCALVSADAAAPVAAAAAAADAAAAAVVGGES